MKTHRIISLFAFALVIIFVIPRAYAIIAKQSTSVPKIENYSALGIVSDVSVSTENISISSGSDSDGAVAKDFSFDASTAKNIESGDYVKLSLNDIKAGDKVILQGIERSSTVTIRRIIDLSWNLASTSVSTSTDVVATSTDAVASSTEATSTATSTASSTIVSTASSTDIVSTSTIISTSTSTDSDASSTPGIATSTSNADSTSTDVVATSTIPIATSTSTSIMTSATSTDATTTSQ